MKPKFKKLTVEQIEDIHSRGKITSEEKVKEWEDLGVCVTGDAMGSHTWRCEKFENCCHDCLLDYANEIGDEHESIFQIMEEIRNEIQNEHDKKNKSVFQIMIEELNNKKF